MKRILLYIVILGAMLFTPVEASDVGKLLPVQVVAVYSEKGHYIMRTDTQDMGVGETVEQALENMKDTAPGIIYLDTAEFLLLEEQTLQAAEELRPMLRDSVRLCLVEGKIDPGETALFLSAHGQLPQLKTWKPGADLPVLTMREKRLIFSKKTENNA